jgi:hypothetical protein
MVIAPSIIVVVPPIIMSRMIAVLTTHVMTVDPLVAVTAMPRHPSHLPVIIPVRSAAILSPISELYADPTRTGEGRDKSADEDNGCD